MPRRWPTVTSSTASTEPAGRPVAVDHLGGVQLHPPGQEALTALGAADEAHVLAVGLARRAQAEAAGVGPHLVLGHVPHREQHPGQRVLPEHGQHVGLVLGRVGAPTELACGWCRWCADTGVVAGGQPVEAQPVGPVQQAVELHGAVALDARVRRPPPRMLPHVGRHDVAVELLGQVEDVVGDAELLGHPAGVLDVGHRAAARVRGPAPQLERGADDLMALLHQERGRDGGVDASRHGHEHPHGTSVPPGLRPPRRSRGHHGGDDGEGAVDVGIGRAIPQREAERTCRQPGRDAHGGEDVAGLERAAGARRPARDADALLAEGHQELFPLDTRHAQVQVAREDTRPRRPPARCGAPRPPRPAARRAAGPAGRPPGPRRWRARPTPGAAPWPARPRPPRPGCRCAARVPARRRTGAARARLGG